MPNILTLIKNEHDQVIRLMQELEKTTDKEQCIRLKNEIIKDLSQHSALEEQLVYPSLAKLNSGAQERSDHYRHEHQELKEMLNKWDNIDVCSNEWKNTLVKIRDTVVEHIREEEEGKPGLFSIFRERLSDDDMNHMGNLWEQMKPIAPTRPHPYAPNTFPGNMFANPLAALIDRIGDIGRKFPK